MVADAVAPETKEKLIAASLGDPIENPRRELFARYCAFGAALADAWAAAGYSTRYSINAQRVNACRLRQEEDVAARISELQMLSAPKQALTMQERRETLAAIVRTKATRFLRTDWSDEKAVQDLGEAAHAIKGLKVKSYEGDNGHMVAEADLDLYDKIAAIREDATLAGERRTDMSINGEVSISHVLQSMGEHSLLPAAPADDVFDLPAPGHGDGGEPRTAEAHTVHETPGEPVSGAASVLDGLDGESWVEEE